MYVCLCVSVVVTITSGLISYPIDTIRRRMMMTSGEAVKYSGSMDCAIKVIRAEGFMALMKGAGKTLLTTATLTRAWCSSLKRSSTVVQWTVPSR